MWGNASHEYTESDNITATKNEIFYMYTWYCRNPRITAYWEQFPTKDAALTAQEFPWLRKDGFTTVSSLLWEIHTRLIFMMGIPTHGEVFISIRDPVVWIFCIKTHLL